MRTAVAICSVLLFLAYPFAVYFGLTHWSARSVGLVLIILLVPALIGRTTVRPRRELSSLRPLGLTMAIVLGASILIDDARFLLALPVLINSALLVTFGVSLFRGPSLVERFARAVSPDLTDEQRRHCRVVTWVWCAFFVVNGAASGALAIWGTLEMWSLYTGLIAYALMGALFAGEFVVRRYRFRQYGIGPHDRILAALFPPRTSDDDACHELHNPPRAVASGSAPR